MRKLKEGIVVSCQALPHEPLHGSKVMGMMAVAALNANAVGIRSNSVKDINSIHKAIKGQLPIIGLIKADYDNSSVYITPTLKEVKKLIKSKCDVIALDVTIQKRPNGETIEDLVKYIKENSNKEIMADISNLEEAKLAEELGCEYISSTLMGYTTYTKDVVIPNVEKLVELKNHITKSILVAEGGIYTLEQVENLKKLGFKYMVIGGAITRPQEIATRFIKMYNKTGE